MQGVCFIIDNIEIIKVESSEGIGPVEESKSMINSTQSSELYGPFQGQLISTIKVACKRAFLNAEPRIVEGMFMCKLEATPTTVGIIYNLVNKARGRVIDENVIDGTQDLKISFLIPLNESFVFT
jgi:translation elongation factor EF-G